MSSVALRREQDVARPLKVLVPLIKSEIAKGDEAGLEHYRCAGELLLEAKEHEAGLDAGMRAGLKALLEQLAPSTVADQFEQGRARSLAPGRIRARSTGSTTPNCFA